MSLAQQIRGIVSRVLPSAVTDAIEAPVRLARYGEIAVVPAVRTKHPLADEGAYFRTGNPTLGTALAGGIQTAYSDTVAALVFYNTADAGGKNLYLDFIKLAFTVAPASATGMFYAVRLDNGGTRAPSAGSTLLTGQGGAPGASPVGPEINQSVAKIWGFTGAFLTVPTSVQARTVAMGAIGSLPVVGTEFSVRFGDCGPGAGGTSVATSHAAPVTVPPGYYCVVHLWFPSNSSTGPSAELDIGWFER